MFQPRDLGDALSHVFHAASLPLRFPVLTGCDALAAPSQRCSTAIWAHSRLCAWRTTTLRGESSTASATTTLRRTGRQCIRRASAVVANQVSSTHQSASSRRSSTLRRGVAVVRWRAPRLGVERRRAPARASARSRSRGSSRRESRRPDGRARNSGPAGRSPRGAAPRLPCRAAAAIWTTAAGTASGSGFGWFAQERTSLPCARDAELVERLPVGQRLARMIDRRLEVDRTAPRRAGEGARTPRRRGRPRGRSRGERADAERVGVAREHRDRLAHVLGGRSPSITAPRGSRAARCPGPAEDERAARRSRAIAACIEARVRSDGSRKSSAEDLSGERARLGPRSSRVASARSSATLFGREIRQSDRNGFTPRSPRAPASGSRRARARRVSGGSRRTTCGSSLVPVRMPRARSSPARSSPGGSRCAGRASSPSPWIAATTGPTLAGRGAPRDDLDPRHQDPPRR